MGSVFMDTTNSWTLVDINSWIYWQKCKACALACTNIYVAVGLHIHVVNTFLCTVHGSNSSTSISNNQYPTQICQSFSFVRNSSDINPLRSRYRTRRCHQVHCLCTQFVLGSSISSIDTPFAWRCHHAVCITPVEDKTLRFNFYLFTHVNCAQLNARNSSYLLEHIICWLATTLIVPSAGKLLYIAYQQCQQNSPSSARTCPQAINSC